MRCFFTVFFFYFYDSAVTCKLPKVVLMTRSGNARAISKYKLSYQVLLFVFFVRSIPYIWMFWCCACDSLHGSIWSHLGSPPGLSRMDGSHGPLVHSWCHHVCDQDPWEVLSWEVWHLGEYVSFIGSVPSYMSYPPEAHQAGLCTCSMKWLEEFLLPPGWDASPSQGYHLPPELNSPLPIYAPGPGCLKAG